MLRISEDTPVVPYIITEALLGASLTLVLLELHGHQVQHVPQVGVTSMLHEHLGTE